ncbi:helix-turn-helix domain-containing protein [Caminicella sporogenes]|uniref:helix-turn-helix domain-containing protein n=1 Tax=Caminicella sporogenes TaxID=166485 RepID=UPI0025412F61|nr:helix-turn-helix domain-containing protein [Caminicella sporogenes]WIF95339.1 helix-turn-helix domain-containing protein [Caminicella sporogenes]
MSNRSKRYTEEFKKQIVGLIESGKSPTEIVKEYNVARSTVSVNKNSSKKGRFFPHLENVKKIND